MVNSSRSAGRTRHHLYFSGEVIAALIRLMILVAVVVASSCGTFAQGGKATKRAASVTPPKWFSTLPSDTLLIIVRGRAEAKDQQLAIDRAVLAARTDIALALQDRWKQLVQEIHSEGIAAPAPAWEPFTLKDTKTRKQLAVKRRRIWTAFVLVSLPKSRVAPLLLEKARNDARWFELVKNTNAIVRLHTSLH